MTDYITEAGRGRPRLVLYASIRGELAARWRHHAVEVEHTRPKTRGNCIDGPRPCPWATCRYHMAVPETKPKRRRPLARLPIVPHQSCALDVADEGPMGLKEIGAWMGVSCERVRQLEMQALRKVRMDRDITEHWDGRRDQEPCSSKAIAIAHDHNAVAQLAAGGASHKGLAREFHMEVGTVRRLARRRKAK